MRNAHPSIIPKPPAGTACVLGATGFIGGQIALAALANGWRVRGVRRNFGATGALARESVDWVQANLSDFGSLVDAMRGSDVVFHAAARYPQGHRQIRRIVMECEAEMARVLAAAQQAGVARLIYTSSLTTLGAPLHDPAGSPIAADERSHYVPGTLRSAYFEAKAAMEAAALRAADVLDVVVLLPTAVFGPGDVKPTTSAVVREAGKGRIPVWFDAVLNVVDGRDVGIAHLLAARRGVRGRRYLVGGSNVTLHDLVALIARCSGARPPLFGLPAWLVRGLIRAADVLPFAHIPDTFRMFDQWQPVDDGLARRELGHVSRPLEDTVRDTLAWFGLLRSEAASES